MTASGTSTVHGVSLSWGAHSETGNRRENQDVFLADHPVFLVADGMGGHDDGRSAALTVARSFSTLVGAERVTIEQVRTAIKGARDLIDSRETAGRAPGSTLAGIALTESDGVLCWLVVNIGDSRVYRLAANSLEQVSIDHSRVQELIDAGQLTPQSARAHGQRNVITRALGGGIAGSPEPDQWLLPVREGDRFLICSDGLSGEVTDQLMTATLMVCADAQQAAETLVRAAVAAGGRDNATAIVVDVIARVSASDVDLVVTLEHVPLDIAAALTNGAPREVEGMD
jgi:serine/threonine protein phosphatase PrpC